MSSHKRTHRQSAAPWRKPSSHKGIRMQALDTKTIEDSKDIGHCFSTLVSQIQSVIILS
jgi:hypothetical protein